MAIKVKVREDLALFFNGLNLHSRSFYGVNHMFALFRSISLLEGLSFLAILSVTFGLLSREYVFFLGISHGVLFMLYLVLSLLVSNQKGWSLKVWLPLFFAAFIPFAFIPVELFLKKSQQVPELAAAG